MVDLGKTIQPCNSYSQNLKHLFQIKLLELKVTIPASSTRAYLSLQFFILCEAVLRFDGSVVLSFFNEFSEIKLKSWLIALSLENINHSLFA